MYCLPVIRARIIRIIILASFFCLIAYTPTSGAEISIGTIIDTVGMVKDSTTIAMVSGNPYSNGSAMAYHDSQMTNGGTLKLTKEVVSGNDVTTGKTGGSGAITSQKVLSYDAGRAAGHISVSESSLAQASTSSDLASAQGCTFSSGYQEGGRSGKATASLDIHSASTLMLSTSTKISPGDLVYSVTANTSLPHSGKPAGPATISSSFTYDSQNPEELLQVYDRSQVSGLFDLFTRVYRGGDGAAIQAQTQGTGMISSKTTAESGYSTAIEDEKSPKWSGTTVYAADLLTNGGKIDETRILAVNEVTASTRVMTYDADGSQAMQSEERVVAVKDTSYDLSSSNGPSCVLAGVYSADSNQSDYQSVSASSLVFGVESAQIVSSAKLDIGTEKNGSAPLVVEYRADITSPILFDPGILQKMTDPDGDGKYEDLNGNGRLDMQDLVLLFTNFEWLSKSNYSSRLDYNSNGRVDLADLTKAFKDIQAMA
jgi:hypothetical protein